MTANAGKSIFNASETPSYRVSFSEPVFNASLTEQPLVGAAFRRVFIGDYQDGEVFYQDGDVIEEDSAQGVFLGPQLVFDVNVTGAVKNEWQVRLMEEGESLFDDVAAAPIMDAAGNRLDLSTGFDDEVYESFIWDKQVPILSDELIVRYETIDVSPVDLTSADNVLRFSKQEDFDEAFIFLDLFSDDLIEVSLALHNLQYPASDPFNYIGYGSPQARFRD